MGDIDGDGFLEIVQGTNEEYVRGEAANVRLSTFATLVGLSPINGRVYAVDHQGSLSPRVAGNPAGPYLPGWPVKIAIFTGHPGRYGPAGFPATRGLRLP